MHYQFGCSTMVFWASFSFFHVSQFLLALEVDLHFFAVIVTGISHNDQVDTSTVLPFVQVGIHCFFFWFIWVWILVKKFYDGMK